jgi:hypothetical protein
MEPEQQLPRTGNSDPQAVAGRSGPSTINRATIGLGQKPCQVLALR